MSLKHSGFKGHETPQHSKILTTGLSGTFLQPSLPENVVTSHPPPLLEDVPNEDQKNPLCDCQNQGTSHWHPLVFLKP